MYDLFGVSNHHGSLTGGHYTAYTKVSGASGGGGGGSGGGGGGGGGGDGQWYLFNDSNTTPVVDPIQVVTSAAYVLFYQRRKGSVKWAFPGVEKLWAEAAAREAAGGGPKKPASK